MDINELRARDARRQELRVAEAELKGRLNAQSEQAQAISSANAATRAALKIKSEELAALEVGDAPGITTEFRPVSLVDNRANTERTVGQTAVALAVKADPAITLEAAMALWTANATAYRESIGRTTPTQNPEGCLEEYLLDMTAAGNIPEPTWEAFRAWIYATPLDKLGI